MEFDRTAYRAALKKFIDERVDLIFVFPTEASMVAKKSAEGTGIPVVFAFANIEGMGLVKSVREPGGNLTGVRYPGPDIAVRRFEVMRELAPKARRYWLPYQKGYPTLPSQLEVLRPVVAAAGVTLTEFPAQGAADLKAELDARAKSGDTGIDAILFLSEPLAVTPDAFVVLAKFASDHKIPFGGAFMSAGGYKSLYGVDINNVNTGRQAAILADKILRGTPADQIPVASSESYFQIDPQAAKDMGLKVDEALLSMANEVVK
jgi:putative ABC transport system substrate-binding protein